MYCPKCGTNADKNETACLNCGLDFTIINNAETSTEQKLTPPPLAPITQTPNKSNNMIRKILFFGLAAIVLILFLIAAARISYGGLNIMEIQSVGGTTLEEAYYAELGEIYSGYALISSALGIFFASVLVWLGIKE